MHSSRLPKLEYDLKHHDGHRSRWEIGDWTDDSDQMILILQSLLDKNGEVSSTTEAMLRILHNIALRAWKKLSACPGQVSSCVGQAGLPGNLPAKQVKLSLWL